MYLILCIIMLEWLLAGEQQFISLTLLLYYIVHTGALIILVTA